MRIYSQIIITGLGDRYQGERGTWGKVVHVWEDPYFGWYFGSYLPCHSIGCFLFLPLRDTVPPSTSEKISIFIEESKSNTIFPFEFPQAFGSSRFKIEHLVDTSPKEQVCLGPWEMAKGPFWERDGVSNGFKWGRQVVNDDYGNSNVCLSHR